MLRDIDVACDRFRLLDQPEDRWHTPLQAAPLLDADRWTRSPRMLGMVRRLAAGPVTPAELRRHAAASLSDVCSFLQACLFLGLAHWSTQVRN